MRVSTRSLSIGDDRLRIAPWRGDPTTAYVVARTGRPSPWALACCLEQLAPVGTACADAGVGSADHGPWLANGFSVHERLHLLSRSTEPPIEATADVDLRRARRRDCERVLEVDGPRSSFWRLDGPGPRRRHLRHPHHALPRREP